MLVRSLSSPSDQVDGKLTIVGINSAHYTGDVVYTNSESTSYWHVILDDLKLNGCGDHALCSF